MHVGRCHFDDYSYFMKIHQHTAFVVVKANRLLAIINTLFVNLDTVMLPLLNKSLVQPVLEYANAVWGPFFSTDQCKLCWTMYKDVPLTWSQVQRIYLMRSG